MIADRLARQIRSGELVLILGPHLAPGAPGGPDWEGLDAALRARLPPPAQAGSLAQRMWRYRLATGRAALLQLLRQHLSPADLRPTPTHRDLARLPAPLFITTAPDQALALAFAEHGRACHAAPAAEAPEPDGQALIAHLFGTLDQPASLALTPPEQDTALSRDLPAPICAALASSDIVLLGCDPADDDVRRMYQALLGRIDRHDRHDSLVWPAIAPLVRATWRDIGVATIEATPDAFARAAAALVAPSEPPHGADGRAAGMPLIRTPDAPLEPDTHPWKGLEFYTEADRDLFFGRASDLRALISQIVSFRSTVLSGTSGVGKTSLLNAAVIPELQQRGYHIVRIESAADPLASLRRGIADAWPDARTGAAQDAARLTAQIVAAAPQQLGDAARRRMLSLLRQRISLDDLRLLLFNGAVPGLSYDDLEGGLELRLLALLERVDHQLAARGLMTALLDQRPDLAEAAADILGVGMIAGVSDVALSRLRRGGALPRLVVVYDEFEKFFRDDFVPPAAREPFVREVVRVCDRADLPIKWIFSLRREAVGSLFTHFEPQSRTLVANLYNLKPLTRDQAALAIGGPAERGGVWIAPGLIEALLTDLETEGAIEPPQLQIVCSALYRRAAERGARELTLHDYEDARRADGILKDHLAGELGRFRIEERPHVRALLVELAAGSDTTIPVSSSDLAQKLQLTKQQVEEFLDRLQGATIIRRQGDQGEIFELTHTYLVREITSWMDQDALAQRTVEHMVAAHARYRPNNQLIPLAPETLETIWPYRQQLHLSDEQRRLVWRSAVRHGQRLDAWVEVCPDTADRMSILHTGLADDGQASWFELPRQHVLEALRWVDAPEAREALQHAALTDLSPALRRRATELLADCTPDAWERLLGAARAGERKLRRSACRALAVLSDQSANPLRLPLRLAPAVSRDVAALRLQRALDRMVYLTIGAALGSLPLFSLLAATSLLGAEGNVQNYRFELVGVGLALGLACGAALAAHHTRIGAWLGAIAGGALGGLLAGGVLALVPENPDAALAPAEQLDVLMKMPVIGALVALLMSGAMLLATARRDSVRWRTAGLMAGGLVAGVLPAMIVAAHDSPYWWRAYVLIMLNLALIGLGIGLGDYFYRRSVTPAAALSHP